MSREVTNNGAVEAEVAGQSSQGRQSSLQIPFAMSSKDIFVSETSKCLEFSLTAIITQLGYLKIPPWARTIYNQYPNEAWKARSNPPPKKKSRVREAAEALVYMRGAVGNGNGARSQARMGSGTDKGKEPARSRKRRRLNDGEMPKV